MMNTNANLSLGKVFKNILCARSHRSSDYFKNNNNLDKINGDGWAGEGKSLHYLKNSDMVGFCRSPVDRRGSPTGSIASTQSQLTPSRQLSDGERLKKTILELIDTERTYVKHLNNLLENYLEPLRNAPFLSSAEVSALFGNIREIVAFQRLFLQALTEAIDMDPGFAKFENPYEFKDVLFSIGSAFLYYAGQFKLYSSFCASHSKAQKVLHPSEGNQALQEFLMSRNPRQQHSSTLESYLIKPIQRILKYPLLLQQLKALTELGSDEHLHLVEALKVMEKVAEHINEMQRIHEEYGAIFDHLFRQHQKSMKQMIDLSPGDLLYYGGVEWLNISDFLGKIKKGLELHAMCFVFKTAVVFLCKERLRQKKKLMGGSGKSSSSEVEIIRYQVLIPVTEVQVRTSTMKDMDNHFLWELIHLKSQSQRRSEKVYHLSNSTSEFRNAFLKTIRQIIRESVRNMNIPANRPGGPSSGSSGTGGSGGSGGGMGGGGGGGGRINTLQPSRSGGGKKRHPSSQTGSLQRHSGSKYDYDAVESYDNVPETQSSSHYQHPRSKSPQPQSKQPQKPQKLQHSPQPLPRHQNKPQPQTSQMQQHPQRKPEPRQSQEYQNYQNQYISELKQRQHQANNYNIQRQNGQRPPLQQENSGSFDSSDPQQSSLRIRSKTVSDALDELSDSTTRSDGGRDEFGTRSEGEDEPSDLQPKRGAPPLGTTPKNLSLSTTSTLSTGSTSSQARLIQASNQPSNYQPAKGAGSPIWKPRENFGSTQSVKSAVSGSSTSISRCGKTRNGNTVVNNNNNQKGLDFRDEFSRFTDSERTQFSYLSSAKPSKFGSTNLHRAHSLLEVHCQNFDNISDSRIRQKNEIEQKSLTKTRFMSSQSILYEEYTSGVSRDIRLEENYVRERYLPRMQTVKTNNNSIVIQHAKHSQFSNNDNPIRSSSLERSSNPASATSLYYGTLRNPSKTNKLKTSFSVDNSPRSSSSSNYSNTFPSSTFVKDGSSFMLVDNSLFDSTLSINSLTPKARSVNLESSNSHKNQLEDTFDKLSAHLINCDPWSDRRQGSKTLDKNTNLDIILCKLRDINHSNLSLSEKYSRNRSVLNDGIRYGSYSSSHLPSSSHSRTSSYAQTFPEDQFLTQSESSSYGDYDDLNLLSLVTDVPNRDQNNFSESIDVLNKTANSIDSLIHQLKKF